MFTLKKANSPLASVAEVKLAVISSNASDRVNPEPYAKVAIPLILLMDAELEVADAFEPPIESVVVKSMISPEPKRPLVKSSIVSSVDNVFPLSPELNANVSEPALNCV